MDGCVIYGLVDPRIEEIRYVGYTSLTPEVRLWGHYYAAHKRARTPLDRWLLKLESLGLQPRIVVVERNPADWCEAEIRWIAHYRELYPGKMKNVADGGVGGTSRSVRAAMAEIPAEVRHERSVRSAATRRANGYVPPAKLPLAPESRERLAATHRGKPKSAEWKAKMAATRRATNLAKKLQN